MHGDVIAGRHSSENKVPVGRELAMPAAVARPWINPADLPPEPHQIGGERYRSSEVSIGLQI